MSEFPANRTRPHWGIPNHPFSRGGWEGENTTPLRCRATILPNGLRPNGYGLWNIQEDYGSAHKPAQAATEAIVLFNVPNETVSF